MTEQAISTILAAEPDLCAICDQPIPEGEVNPCPMLGEVHPGCHTYANGCRGETCDRNYEGN